MREDAGSERGRRQRERTQAAREDAGSERGRRQRERTQTAREDAGSERGRRQRERTQTVREVLIRMVCIIPNSLMFSPLFLMDMNHQMARQNATANRRVGLVTLHRGRGKSEI